MTYLQLDEKSRSEPLESYQAMLDRLWNERVLRAPNGAARSRLATSIADLMAEEESLWLARARFEEAANDIEALIAAGILTLSTSGVSIGFAPSNGIRLRLGQSLLPTEGPALNLCAGTSGIDLSTSEGLGGAYVSAIGGQSRL